MRHVLFVDDEPNILEGLQRMLRVYRDEWTMAFAPDAQAALSELKAAPFDVIVSDMRMPGMDGAALLARVKEEFPKVIRIVLSGHTDLEASMRAVPVAHQFLTKPCEAVALKETISRTCDLQALLEDQTLRSVVGEIDRLPSLPRIYRDLTQALKDPEVSLERVTRIVEQDVAMCAKVLQLVNSSFFGLPRRVSNVKMAIGRLGTTMLRNLVLSVEIFAAFQPKRGEHFSPEAAQRHAFMCATIAKRLLPDRLEAEDAFAAGMLHDVGMLVLAARMPELFARLFGEARARRRPEAMVEGSTTVHHGSIGGYLLGVWGLPYSIVEAVVNHHVPSRVSQRRFDVVAAVHVANFLAHEQSGTADDGDVEESLDMPYLEALGVADKVPEWRAMAAEQIAAAAA